MLSSEKSRQVKGNGEILIDVAVHIGLRKRQINSLYCKLEKCGKCPPKCDQISLHEKANKCPGGGGG